ncbi:MAG: ribosome recycling factor [Pseudanabaena sp.]|uniref:ribosome recycling factor n=1 Tax=Pseudanabaena mucicola TaxID=71190 RepID=UPI0025760828|nr:ribosome recycling factor [Pseudanabaena mucicola]MCA6574170.1 ribosome recycling factor [Pseudanabaena sp. M53BS1SP1A06MG]MCA6581860.1 ribosome recycling factor [Pseudanabaena sp. M34BS1SP1A06MG]MCA6587128.1 ribosome recycling factor [Pseudanabaena sp. M051S1SP1A06QC]MCA6590322.1 ribosome recycling factor [Pseudanabaena sp. M109S1SP1A06QC]MCA6592402.1 ribosome recycling factor [Pseudanabaena sp. M38BS1SP1A06MG]MCA6596507.1 ribosome recycling factor [Pseudanabaena sp. M046S1SP1A06QC]MCA66
MKLTDVEARMQKAVEATQHNFNTVRTGRANASLLDRITVEYYGAETHLKALASISSPDASTLQIQPFDRSTMRAIEKAISESDIGLTPNNDGTSIRLNIPPLTTDRRKELVKMVAKLAEEGKVAIRNVRRDAIDSIRKLEKAKEISEDDSKSQQEQVDKLTEKFVKTIDKVTAEKEKEITTI